MEKFLEKYKKVKDKNFVSEFIENNFLMKYNSIDWSFVKNLENSWTFSNLRIMCDFETDKKEYWWEIEKILLYNWDFIVRKK